MLERVELLRLLLALLRPLEELLALHLPLAAA